MSQVPAQIKKETDETRKADLQKQLDEAQITLATAQDVMTVIFSTKYSESSYPFRIYALLIPLRCTSFGAILTALGRPKLVTVMSGAALTVNAVLSIVFVRALGPAGAASTPQ